jgi:hypothetical protein
MTTTTQTSEPDYTTHDNKEEHTTAIFTPTNQNKQSTKTTEDNMEKRERTHLINREHTHMLILRFNPQSNEIQQHINDEIDLCNAAENHLQYYKPTFDDITLDPMIFLLNSYADSITIKDTRNALNKIDGIKTPSPPPTSKLPDDDEFDFSFTSSSEDDFTSDDE